MTSINIDRRHFLAKTTAASTAGWFFASPAPGEDDGVPITGKELAIRSRSPYNAGAELDDLVKNWMTPTKHFYVRNHAPVPKIDAKTFAVSIDGLVKKPLKLTLAELTDRFKTTSVVATMTCAGNRRYEHSKIKKVGGVQWREGAIGNARWGGVRLSDVLKAAGIKPEAKHIWFEGVDRIRTKAGGLRPAGFGGSIPIEKAFLDTKSMPGTLICHQMNGESLAPAHGYPLRTVVPGYIGARSVKWLGKIVVSDRPSPNHYLASAYKIVTEGSKLEWAEAGPLYAFPINSVICTPSAGAKLKAGLVRVTGYALPNGRPGRTISRVQLSADGGRSIVEAKITSPKREYCWSLWQADVKVTPKTKELIVRAGDSAGDVQPKSVKWNMKGYMYNAWHRVPVSVS